MAETFLFNIAAKVLGKLGSLALQEVYLAWGVLSQLKKLENTLSTIQAVLLDAEEQHEKNCQLADWLGKLKDALYDADDVLDEFQYEALRSQVVNRGGSKRKVRNIFSSSNPLAFHFKMGHKIKKIGEKFDEIAAEKAKFHLTERFVDRCVVHREREITHSFVRAADVIGRDNDKENIVQLLMSPGDGGNVSIIPIIGFGGLGKTTLAKLVYNDVRVVRNFELKMWVCVSEDFDVTKLTKEIIKSAIGKNCDDLTTDQLQSCLRSTLDNKKFLLILDDVWNDDRDEWFKLRDLLLGGANGSKIILTTRTQLVASIMGAISTYNLKGLSHEQCLSLFVKWAFREGEEKLYPNLLKIGEEIVKKCGGVPLAVKTLGSLLYLKTGEHDWLFIKDNEIWKFEQKKNDILPALRLSYDGMPSYLKQCFVFCSLFPKDYQFYDFQLTQFWMAQGLLQSSDENEELEDIGQRYFKELWSRSFFQDVEDQGTSLTFKMHDLVHDLALSVAHSECSIVNFCTQNISKKVRHVSYSNVDLLEEGVPRFVPNVRTILFLTRGVEPTSQSILETFISRFKYLRMLDLSNSCFEVCPRSIGNLKHLRYLNLSYNFSLKRLPNSICKLLNLQTLDLSECMGIVELPRDIGNLISLRYLKISTRWLIFLEGIGRLNSLRFLGIIGCTNIKSLGEGMQHFTALRTLFIWHCRSLQSLPGSMKHLTALQSLDIYDCIKLNSMEWEEDIQGLRLSLRSLKIRWLPLVAFPQWLQGAANTLQIIHITNCSMLTALPEWLQNLTSLQKLEIIECPKLLALPEGMHRLTTLRELKINRCHKLTRRCEPEIGEDWPKIAHVPQITLEFQKIISTDN